MGLWPQVVAAEGSMQRAELAKWHDVGWATVVMPICSSSGKHALMGKLAVTCERCVGAHLHDVTVADLLSTLVSHCAMHP